MSTPLKSFFEGATSVDDLRAAAKIRIQKTASSKSIGYVEILQEPYCLIRAHLISLCDYAISGELTEEELSDIAFWIQAADEIYWEEDEVIERTLFEWSCPEITFPLTLPTLKRFRERLSTGDLTVAIK